MRIIVVTGLLLSAGCRDSEGQVAATRRCETLLAAQERADPGVAIRPKDTTRISEGDATIFVRRSYDRPTGPAGAIERRDYTCTFDKRIGKVVTLSTNGHRQEMRFGDAEWAATSKPPRRAK